VDEQRCEWEERCSYDLERPYAMRPHYGSLPSELSLRDVSEQVAALPDEEQIDGVPKELDGLIYFYDGPAKYFAEATTLDFNAGAGFATLCSNLPIGRDIDDTSDLVWPARRELFCYPEDVAQLEAFHDPERDFDEDDDLPLPDHGSDRFEAWITLRLTSDGVDHIRDNCGGPPSLSFGIVDNLMGSIGFVPAHEYSALLSLLDWYVPMTKAEESSMHEAVCAAARAGVAGLAA